MTDTADLRERIARELYEIDEERAEILYLSYRRLPWKQATRDHAEYLTRADRILALLSPAPSEREPVAWRHRSRERPGNEWGPWYHGSSYPEFHPHHTREHQVEPLYSAASPPEEPRPPTTNPTIYDLPERERRRLMFNDARPEPSTESTREPGTDCGCGLGTVMDCGCCDEDGCHCAPEEPSTPAPAEHAKSE